MVEAHQGQLTDSVLATRWPTSTVPRRRVPTRRPRSPWPSPGPDRPGPSPAERGRRTRRWGDAASGSVGGVAHGRRRALGLGAAGRRRRLRGPRRRTHRPGRFRDGARDGRVIVVGAGLAGLTAALDLVEAGWDVVVLEARDRSADGSTPSGARLQRRPPRRGRRRVDRRRPRATCWRCSSGSGWRPRTGPPTRSSTGSRPGGAAARPPPSSSPAATAGWAPTTSATTPPSTSWPRTSTPPTPRPTTGPPTSMPARSRTSSTTRPRPRGPLPGRHRQPRRVQRRGRRRLAPVRGPAVGGGRGHRR